MSARYWVQTTDDLMNSDPQWPPTFRPVERGGIIHPGLRWWLFEDDDAPDDLNGKEVQVNLIRAGDAVMIERTVIQPGPQRTT